MKNIIKTGFFALVALCLGSCTKNFENYNTNPNALFNLPAYSDLRVMIEPMMFSAANQAQYTDMMVGAYGGYFTAIHRWTPNNFDTFNPGSGYNDTPFSDMFTDTYNYFFSIERKTGKEGDCYYMGKLVRAATMMRVADCYGPIPYSKMRNGYLYAEYDAGPELYANIIKDLQDAADYLYTFASNNTDFKPFEDYDPSAYKGDYSLWARLANSLVMRAAMRVGDQTAFEAAANHAAGYIESNSQNATKAPAANGNPYWVCGEPVGGYNEWRASSSIVDYMNGYGDPRRASYFKLATQVGYTGQYVGARTGYGATTISSGEGYSLVNTDRQASQVQMFVAAENEFLLAEAALKGWNVTGTAQSHYEAGIALSMNQHGVDTAVAATYLADATSAPASHTGDFRVGQDYTRTTTVKIAWDGAGTSNLEQIITQKWIANFPMGLEAWADFRRTGFPELAPSINNNSPGNSVLTVRGARRLAYPSSERNLNTQWSDDAIANKLGGADTQGTDLFWAKTN